MCEADVYYSPKGVDIYHLYFSESWPDADELLDHPRPYIRNLSYSLQYLEYLNNLLRPRGSQGNIHVSVLTHLHKTFIIVGMGVIESVLWYAVRRAGAQKSLTWKPFQELIANPKKIGREAIRSRVILEKYIDPPEDVEMSLDAMTKKAESKKLLGVGHEIYAKLHHLRNLRNRVHIHSVQHDRDSDWWSITREDWLTMKEALYAILTCDLFHPSTAKADILDFLKAPAGQGTP